MTEELSRCGVRQAVISPGSRSTPLAVALWRHPGIRVTVALDERSGSFFALGAAQSTGVPVVLLCTSGTAAANYHPAVAEAALSSVPLIVLTADRPPELRDIGAGQTIDQIKLYGSAVRWFCEVGVHDADDPGLLHFRSTACRACAAASGDPRPGPVHLNVAFRDPLAPLAVPGAVTATDRLALEGRGDRPLTAVVQAARQTAPATVAEIQALLSEVDRVAIVAGRRPSPEIRAKVSEFAALVEAPILAEPTSQLRCGPHDRSRVISGYDRIAGDAPAALEPDLIVRVGEMPTSKTLRTWLGSIDGLCQVIIDPGHSWNEPLRTADLIVRSEPVELLGRLSQGSRPEGSRDFLDSWLEADGRADTAIEAELDGAKPQVGSVHRALARLHSDGDLVYTASSMAIRDQEQYLGSSASDLLFLANRGANGIDGLLASGIGAAVASGRPTTVITGDLGFQHDLGSLALIATSDVPVRVVVLNDDGGSIFSRLPQKEAMVSDEFDTLMRTPAGLDVSAAARMFDTRYFRIDDLSQLSGAFAAGSAVIEIPLPA
jgi:2-succinyl-5-enolpyruvyl-6-hydroxy-3-cyclohexene-1-carboxylate synthase